MESSTAGKRSADGRVKVAFIQGALAHSRATNIYEGFDARYEIVVVGAKKCDIGESDIRQEHRRLYCVRDFLRHIPKVRHRIPWPDQQHLFGFEKAMADMGLLFPQGSIMQFAYQCIQLKRKTGIKVVVFDLENVPYAFRHYSAKRQAERAAVLRESDAIIAASGQVKRCMLMEGVSEEKIHVIYEGVNQEVFKPGPKSQDMLRQLGLTEDDIVVMFVGQFSWRKGPLTLLYAAKCLALDDEVGDAPVRFVFVGRDGAEELRDFAQRIGLADRVLVHDWISYRQMPDVYRCSDIVTVPSIPIPTSYEQSSAAMREAATIGKALILAQTGGMPELMGDAALYFPPADYYSLYQVIKDLVLSNKKREEHGRRARSRACAVLDAAVTREKTARVFDSVLG